MKRLRNSSKFHNERFEYIIQHNAATIQIYNKNSAINAKITSHPSNKQKQQTP